MIIEPPESVLEGLERAGFSIPFSCRAGLCQRCLMQADSQPPPSAQQGLSESQKAQHFFLSCSCIPRKDMTVNLVGETARLQGRVVDKKMLNKHVLALWIAADCRWFPGQYLTLWRDKELGRSYSIASLCDEGRVMELHIKRHHQGLVSRWLHDQVAPGQSLELSKPMGHCFYTDEHGDKPLLMVATGTGLAPLYGILQEALRRRHSAPIYLYAAAGEPGHLYYVDRLQQLAKEYQHFHYLPLVRRRTIDEDGVFMEEDVVAVVQQRHQELKGWKIF